MELKIAFRRSVFFTLDSLLASGILITAILLASDLYSAEYHNPNVNYAAQDLLGAISYIEIKDLKNDYVSYLVQSGDITDTNITILDQLGDFWNDGKEGLAANLTLNITSEIVSPNLGYELLINGSTIYARNMTVGRSLSVSRRLISGISDDDSLWGPVVVEVRAWE